MDIHSSPVSSNDSPLGSPSKSSGSPTIRAGKYEKLSLEKKHSETQRRSFLPQIPSNSNSHSPNGRKKDYSFSPEGRFKASNSQRDHPSETEPEKKPTTLAKLIDSGAFQLTHSKSEGSSAKLYLKGTLKSNKATLGATMRNFQATDLRKLSKKSQLLKFSQGFDLQSPKLRKFQR